MAKKPTKKEPINEDPIIIDSETGSCPTEPNPAEIEAWPYFSTNVYVAKKPEFLKDVKKVALQSIPKEAKNYNDIYPVVMSYDLSGDSRIEEFITFVGQTAWTILDSQGYAMENVTLQFSSMWMQEHHKHSLMEQHTHAFGDQLVGFYFLDTPEDCSRLIIHDPRPAKVQINLPQKDISAATNASDMINFKPEPGMLIITNAWLQHSFGRHASTRPLRFIHFNLNAFFNATASPEQTVPDSTSNTSNEAEVI